MLVLDCLFLSACGLEQFYEITPCSIDEQVSIYSDISEQVCKFTTADFDNALKTELEIYGTQVFYRIYGTKTAMDTHVAAINTANTAQTENGYNKLKSLQYQPIYQTIPFGSKDKTVTLRLWSYFTYPSQFSFDEGRGTQSDLGAPLRYNQQSFTFTRQYTPTTNDLDTERVTSDTTVWYVPVFAVTYGRTPYVPSLYSELEYLGFFTVEIQ